MKVLKIIAWVAIGPAVYVNIEATPMPWTPFAIGSVIAAAVFVFLAKDERSFWFGVLGTFFILINVATALDNVASMSDATRDGRSSAIQRRTALNKARKVQTDLAGEEAAQTVEGQIKALIASDATRYAASEHCNPDKITKPETRTFCDNIAKLGAKKAAAIERAKIDEKLAALDKEAPDAPSSADPYAESLARFLVLFGYQVDDEGKALLSSSKDWGRAIGLELMAAFGPMALTLLFERLFGSHPMPVPASGRNREIVRPKEEAAPVPSIELPAMPHVAVAEPSPSIALRDEPAPAALVAELEVDEPTPLPPPPSRRKRTVSNRKPKRMISGPSATVIPFRKDISGEVHAMLAAGRKQREVADHLGIGLRTVGRIVAASKTSQMASDLAAS